MRYPRPLRLETGDTVRWTCHYDNPGDQPVAFGLTTEDEMCFALGFFYPDRADFIAFVGELGARPLVHRALASFRRHARFPSEGVAAPAVIPGVNWSDHWSFTQQGYPAIMVTDTAFYRYAHYHQSSDTPDRLDYARLAKVVLGLAAVMRDLTSDG